jgi:hypothetical protein
MATMTAARRRAQAKADYDASLAGCPSRTVLDRISDKRITLILAALGSDGRHRPGTDCAGEPRSMQLFGTEAPAGRCQPENPHADAAARLDIEPVGQPVRQRVVDAGVENPVADLGLLVPSRRHAFSRNWRYVDR